MNKGRKSIDRIRERAEINKRLFGYKIFPASKLAQATKVESERDGIVGDV